MNMNLDELFKIHQKLADGEVVLDVRNPDEFAAGHIKNALNIPLPELTARAQELKKFKTVYIHCKRGGRAKTAYEGLKNLGYTNVVCIGDAGMDHWIEKGYPFEK